MTTTWDQSRLWDEHAAATYDTPGEGCFADAVVGPTVDRLAQLAGNGAALELAIGTGRIAVPLRERGVPVSGIELSAPMVEVLRTKASPASIPVTVGDMTITQVTGPFSLVYLVFNTLGNLLTQAEQVACFRNAASHVQPGGRFVVEMMVPRLREVPPGRPGMVYTASEGYVAVDTYEPVSQLLISHHFRFDHTPDARLSQCPQRYVWPAEMDLMGQLAGFELESRHADWTGGVFTAESTSHVSTYVLR